jgi:DNA-binding MarR family transcriptional regulator/GNAT superfamily N-acetyltransferase
MVKSSNNQFKDALIPARIKNLGQKLNKDISFTYEKLNIKFEPKWFMICRFLENTGSASINEIAAALDLTHPAIVQLVNEMEKNNIVETVRDPDDMRKRMVSLTGKGKVNFNAIFPVLADIEEAITDLGRSAGFDIIYFVNSLESALDTKSFYKRIMEKNKKRLLDSVEVLRYSPRYKNDFQQLNYEWLNKYFKVEEEDEKILSNPEDSIINKGGEIFFARIENEIIGTCAAIKVDKYTYELAKMAVTEKAQGKQAGKKLALAVIGFAYSKGAKSVILETSSKLQQAIRLYELIGFKNVPGNFTSKYNRPLFRMQLDLK